MVRITSQAERVRAGRDVVVGLLIAASALGIAQAALVMRAVPDLIAFAERTGRSTSPADPVLFGAALVEASVGVAFGVSVILASRFWRIGLASWVSALVLLGIAIVLTFNTLG